MSTGNGQSADVQTISVEAAKLLDELRRCSAQEVAVEPDDSEWKTVRQWAAIFGVQRAQADKLLADGVDGGVMERSRRMGRDRNGNPKVLNHFRLVDR